MAKKKLPKSGLVTIIVLIAGALLFGPRILAGLNRTEAVIAEASAFSVRTHEVTPQTLRSYLEVNGDVICTQQVEVFPDMGGILVAVRADLGSTVTRGQIIAEVDPSRPGLVYFNSPVRAPISGTISKTPLSTGSTVSQNTSITAISTNENLEILSRIPEREIAHLDTGLTAEVFLQAYPGETFNATVIRVSPIVDSTSRTKLINLQFDDRDTRISSGMFGRVRLNTRTYEDVLAIPSEAVIANYGVQVVYVVEQDASGQPVSARREVTSGASLQGLTEIRSGLEAGDVIVVQGQQLLSGGESLRIIGSVSARSGGDQERAQ